MFYRLNLPESFQYILKLFLLPIALVIFVTACGDGPASPAEQLEDPRGAIQGEVFDKATGEALSGVQVTVVDTSGAENAEWSATTENNGVFTINDIPVTADAKTKAESGGYTNPYTLHLNASSLENYRDSYKAEVDVVFESTGGDGAVSTDIVSKVKLPLSKQSVTVTGKAQTNSHKVISGATVELYQYYNPVINGSSDTQTEMLLTTAETGEDGSFSFEHVEEDASIYIKFTDKSDPANVVSGRYPSSCCAETTPSGSEDNPTLDLGVVKVSLENESGAFYVTDVIPGPDSNIGEDQEFAYVFNRPVAENSYTDASASFGVGSMKDDIQFEHIGEKSFDKSPGDVEFSVSWCDSRDTLYIEPEVSTMKDGSEYELSVDAFKDDRFVDEHDNNIMWGASDYSNAIEDLTFYTNFNTETPHTPEIAVDSTSLNTNWNNGSHTIEWSMDNDPADVKEYEIYISRDGGAYQHLATKSAGDASFGELEYGLDATSNPTNTDVMADQPDWFDAYSNLARVLMANQNDAVIDHVSSHEVKVRAVSKNLVEGEFSDPITFEDVTEPQFTNSQQGAVGQNEEDQFYINVSEPLDKGTAENADNYTITDATNGEISISSVTYELDGHDNPAGGSGFDIVITVEDASNLTSGDIEITSDVTDLTGNGMDDDNNSQGY